MPDALERLVNLAIYLSDTRSPVTAEQVRSDVIGYPQGQDADAFIRMFERDKDDLRAAGLAIDVVDTDGIAAYRLDRSATFVAEVPMSSAEIAAVRAVGASLAADPAFPYAEDLRLALAKVMPGVGEAPDAVARMADESPESQGEAVAVLAAATEARKSVRFGYENAVGERKSHEVDPYGLFLREGRWYLVGRDTRTDSVRVYAVSRMDAPEVEPHRPKHPDFDRPDGFDVRTFVGLPFQYGAGGPFEAELLFRAEAAWRAASLTAGVGETAPQTDGSVEWRVPARDPVRLARWVFENGPGIELAGPPEAVSALRDGLAEAVAVHGG